MKLPPLSFVVLDTETTGFVPRVHRIMEFACARVESGTVTEEYETLCTVPEEIPPHIQIITRIKMPMLEGKPAFEAVRDTIAGKLEGVQLLVGQNLGFDLGMLKGEGIDVTDKPWVDTSLLAALLFPELRSYSLQYLSATLGLHHDPPHRALGDVRATTELLSRIWERLCQLPSGLREDAKRVMEKAPLGYQMLFAALPEATTEGRSWPFPAKPETDKTDASPMELTPGGIVLLEERLQPEHLQSVIDAAARTPGHRHLIAVKNLEATLRRFRLPEGVRPLHPPSLLLDPAALRHLLEQPSLTADEATLAAKIAWFSPATRSDIAVHGGEKDAWNGKLACTEKSAAYTAQFENPPAVFMLDQRQLFQFLSDPQSAAHGVLDASVHVIIDDASMLEDNATKALGAFVSLDDLRAGAQGNELLMRAVDMAVLWAEKTRTNEDLHFLLKTELETPETKGLLALLDEIQAGNPLQPRMADQIAALKRILDASTPPDRLKWIEHRMQSALMLHEAPEYIDRQLQEVLFSKYAATLIVPSGIAAIPEIIPAGAAVTRKPLISPHPEGLAVSYPDKTLEDVLRDPPAGKTIGLAGSKHLIEKLYVKYTEELEEKGVTLICQGMSGGMNRMESEFLAAEAPVIMLLTPWMYEGSELPAGCVDRLILEQLPFDHPNQPVFQKRKDHYRDWFGMYMLPRLTQRLFRLTRTFCRHRTAAGEILVLDKRLKEKAYGKDVIKFLNGFSAVQAPLMVMPAKAAEPKPAAKKEPPAPPNQPSLF